MCKGYTNDFFSIKMEILPYFGGVVSGVAVGFAFAWHADFRLRALLVGLGLSGMIACGFLALDL
jgi:hypothetical protein